MSEPEAIWVISDVTPDGTYVVTVHAGDDVAFTLDRTEALAYAATVMDAAARAEFDASVMAQHLALGAELPLIAGIIADLRKDRPPLTFAHAIMLDPIVSASSHEAVLTLLINGRKIGQWSVDDARSHALDVLTVVAGVDLDAAYRRYLVGSIGLDDQTARAVVGGLHEHRAADEVTPR